MHWKKKICRNSNDWLQQISFQMTVCHKQKFKWCCAPKINSNDRVQIQDQKLGLLSTKKMCFWDSHPPNLGLSSTAFLPDLKKSFYFYTHCFWYHNKFALKHIHQFLTLFWPHSLRTWKFPVIGWKRSNFLVDTFRTIGILLQDIKISPKFLFDKCNFTKLQWWFYCCCNVILFWNYVSIIVIFVFIQQGHRKVWKSGGTSNMWA